MVKVGWYNGRWIIYYIWTFINICGMKSLIFNLFCQSCDKVLVGVFIMTFTIFGLSFLIQAVFNALGKNTFLGKEYRNSEEGRIYYGISINDSRLWLVFLRYNILCCISRKWFYLVLYLVSCCYNSYIYMACSK